MSVWDITLRYRLRTHFLQQHVAWYLKYHNGQKHELICKVDRGLIDSYVLREPSGQCTGDVHSIELEDEQTKEQQRQDGGVDSVVVRLALSLALAARLLTSILLVAPLHLSISAALAPLMSCLFLDCWKHVPFP